MALLSAHRLTDAPATHPTLQAQAYEVARAMAAQNVDVRVAEAYRSIERSDDLFAQGRTTPGPIVSNARGGESAHNFRMAYDVELLRDGVELDEVDPAWVAFVRLVKADPRVKSGADFPRKDVPHVELADWQSLKGWDSPPEDNASTSDEASASIDAPFLGPDVLLPCAILAAGITAAAVALRYL